MQLRSDLTALYMEKPFREGDLREAIRGAAYVHTLGLTSEQMTALQAENDFALLLDVWLRGIVWDLGEWRERTLTCVRRRLQQGRGRPAQSD